ncbi:hypothetical protein J7438_09425 [Thalassotalea sp. G20_0]|nr:hypothetical protein [Thalassotalea sp. G20_0]
MKEFVIEFYHKSNTTNLAQVARKAVKPAKAFCDKKNLKIHLAPTNIERTFKDWLREHRKHCPICAKKMPFNTVA